ncbi:MAG: glycosyltransferase family 2 protein [Armatimonadota bacterium]
MPDPVTISALVITYQRPDELNGALENLLAQDRPPDEIIVIDNDPAGSGRDAPLTEHERVSYLCTGENLGVAAGRNRAAGRAAGDVLVFIDDDARFSTPAALTAVAEAFTEHERMGVLAFLIRNAWSGEIRPSEHPHPDAGRWAEPREVSYFLGGACAIRSAVFSVLGGFDETFFYNGEELEFSFRLLDAGWHLRYRPDVEVLHRVSALGRGLTTNCFWLVRNRVYVAMKHLPFPYLLTYLTVWSGFAFLQALRGRRLGEFLRGLRALRKEGLLQRARAYRKEHPMRRETITYLHRNGGRLFY